MYVIDPSTNLAETAFIVHPDWQGVGLGSALQRRLAEHAQGRGVRGFVADILATNDNMIRLAMAGAGQVHSENLGGSVRVTSLF
jgi:GNAT superfamily N-acetyltransferase